MLKNFFSKVVPRRVSVILPIIITDGIENKNERKGFCLKMKRKIKNKESISIIFAHSLCLLLRGKSAL